MVFKWLKGEPFLSQHPPFLWNPALDLEGRPMTPAPDHQSFMRRAIELSHIHMEAGEGGPFGAVVVKDGTILGEGWNRVTSTCDPTAHAEVVAIRAACDYLGTFSLKGCEIYTSCEPCPMCLAAVYWSRLDAIFFGNTAADAARAGFDDSFLYQEVARPHQQRTITIRPLLWEQAWSSFAAWQQSSCKTDY